MPTGWSVVISNAWRGGVGVLGCSQQLQSAWRFAREGIVARRPARLSGCELLWPQRWQHWLPRLESQDAVPPALAPRPTRCRPA